MVLTNGPYLPSKQMQVASVQQEMCWRKYGQLQWPDHIDFLVKKCKYLTVMHRMEKRFPSTPQAGLGTCSSHSFTGDFNTGCPNMTIYTKGSLGASIKALILETLATVWIFPHWTLIFITPSAKGAVQSPRGICAHTIGWEKSLEMLPQLEVPFLELAMLPPVKWYYMVDISRCDMPL